MKTLTIPLQKIGITTQEGLKQGSQEHIKAYFNDSGPDYKAWSEHYNMHFGYYTRQTGLFNREAMLEQMNMEVGKRLRLNNTGTTMLADLGCGMGATAATLGANYPNAQIHGITIVPWQVQVGNALIRNRKLKNVRLHLSDISNPIIPDESADAAYAVESFCYGDGLPKSNFVRGLRKVLRPGGRFVVVDGFITRPKEKFNPVFNYLYKTVCKNWALTDFADISQFREALVNNGLEIDHMEDASWRIAPSALQVPVVTSKFIWNKFRHGDHLNQLRWGHLKACICGMLIGMFRSHFSYYIISGKKN